jgi:HD superfamily phosphohydrolase YqeK
MTLTEKLLYLADYIDESRTFPSCVLLRRYFFGAEPELMTKEEREKHLRATLLLSYEHTLKDLLAEGAPIDQDTVRARNELLVEADKSTQ